MKITLKTENYEKYYKALLPHLKKDKNQKYLTVFLTIGVSIFFILFAINPTLSTIAKLKKEISDNRQLDEKLTQKIENLSSLGSAYEEIQDDLPYIEAAIPKKPEAPTLIAQIQSLAKEAGVSTNSIQVSPMNLIVSESSRGSMFVFSISAEGQYNDFSRFLSYLITMQRALTIESVQITETDFQSHIVNGIIKGSAFFKK